MKSLPDSSRPVGSGKYRAFLSYSQAADHQLAPALELGLQRFSKPWYRLHALRIFRDADLSATPELWGAIERALAQSDFLVLLASPLAAQSRWVQQEVDWWLRHRTVSRLLIVLTDGEARWDPAAGDFDWSRTNALPRQLEKAFAEEPLYLDLRWARRDTDLSLRQPRFAAAVANLSATLRGKSLDELTGEDVRQHARAVRLLRLAVGALALLTVAALVAAALAIQARNTAQRVARGQADHALAQANEARSRKLAAVALNQGGDAELQTLLALEAMRLAPTPEADSALRQSLFASLKPALTLPTNANQVSLGIFSPDGARILTFGDSAPRLWDAQSGQLLNRLTAGTNETARASFSRDGRWIVTASDDGVARLWDVASAKVLQEFPQEDLWSALLSPDASRLLTLSVGGIATLWDARAATKIADHDYQPSPTFSDHLAEAAFSPDGSRVALCTRLDPVVIDARDGQAQFWLEGHSRPARGVDFSPDGNWIVSVSEDGTARKWRTANGQSVATWRHDTPLYACRFSPDGRWVATRDAEANIILWEAETGRRAAVLEIRSSPKWPVIFQFSPSSRCLITASLDAAAAAIWEVGSGARLAEISGEQGELRSLRFSPDSRRVLVGAFDAPVRLYECPVCGSAEDLVEFARTRVSRQLTDAERARFVAQPVTSD